MFYVKKAFIQLRDNQSLTVNRKDAQTLYNQTRTRKPLATLLLTDFDRTIHPDLPGPVTIEKHAVLFIAYTEDAEANHYSEEIRNKWKEILKLTDVKDDGGCDWFTDGKNTYIGDETWKVSEDPYIASLLLKVQELEDKLDAHLKGDKHV